MGDVHAEHAPEALMDPTDPWETLGAHVVEAKGARGARVGGGVSVVSLTRKNFCAVARARAGSKTRGCRAWRRWLRAW